MFEKAVFKETGPKLIEYRKTTTHAKRNLSNFVENGFIPVYLKTYINHIVLKINIPFFKNEFSEVSIAADAVEPTDPELKRYSVSFRGKINKQGSITNISVI